MYLSEALIMVQDAKLTMICRQRVLQQLVMRWALFSILEAHFPTWHLPRTGSPA